MMFPGCDPKVASTEWSSEGRTNTSHVSIRYRKLPPKDVEDAESAFLGLAPNGGVGNAYVVVSQRENERTLMQQININIAWVVLVEG
jgi:hypothetical protein